MQRMLLTVGLLTLWGASGLFIGVPTASADEHESGILMYEVGTAIEPLTLPAVPEGRGTPPLTYRSHAGSAGGFDV